MSGSYSQTHASRLIQVKRSVDVDGFQVPLLTCITRISLITVQIFLGVVTLVCASWIPIFAGFTARFPVKDLRLVS